jgi:hypothetical protein
MVYVYLVRFVIFNWVCWVRGNFSGEPGHVYIRVCVSAVWSAVPVQFYLGISVVWAAGLYGFSFPLALQWRVRYGRIGEGGVVRFSFAFYSLLIVLLAVGCLR